MADLGHQLTDKELKKLEQQIRKEYYEAQKDVHKKLTAYLEKTEAQRQIEFKKYKNGEISKKDYDDFVYRHNMVGKRWKDMRTELAETFHHSNEVALQMSKDKMPDIFALNANWGTYQIEHDAKIDTGFVLYNHDTAAYLLTDKRQLMPGPSTTKQKQIAANKDMQWNERKIQSAVLQGVLQGESPYQVADRLREVGQMNYNASVRYARTMTTSAQNAGRYESYRRAKGLGVDLTVEWQATLDHRTRHHHRQMHGQRTDVDKPFHTPDGYTIYYPADCTGESTAPQKEIWNCRCTLLAWVKGFEGDTVKSSPKMGEQSFEDWQNGKQDFTSKKEQSIIEPTFAEKISVIKQEIISGGGKVTEDHIMRAGETLADEYSQMVAQNEAGYSKYAEPYKVEYNNASIAYNDYKKRYDKVKNKLSPEEDEMMRKELARLGAEVVNKRDAFFAARKPYMLTQDSNVEWLTNKIGEVRATGYSGINLTNHLIGRPSAEVKSVEYAYSHYPTDWVKKSIAKGNIGVKSGSRGSYVGGRSAQMVISGSGAKANAVAFHELGHRFEEVVDGMPQAERTFYNRRTAGSRLVPLGKGYGSDEYTRKDNFIDKYIGKDYGTGKDYELVSMGFQYAYTEPATLAKDPDFQKWIYGQLLLL